MPVISPSNRFMSNVLSNIWVSVICMLNLSIFMLFLACVLHHEVGRLLCRSHCWVIVWFPSCLCLSDPLCSTDNEPGCRTPNNNKRFNEGLRDLVSFVLFSKMHLCFTAMLHKPFPKIILKNIISEKSSRVSLSRRIVRVGFTRLYKYLPKT